MKAVAWVVMAAMAVGTLGMAGCQNADNTRNDSKQAAVNSLYARLGGATGVKKITSGWVDRITADPALKARFAQADTTKMKDQMAQQMGELTGGPEVYLGPDVKRQYQGMNISETEWKAFIGALRETLVSDKVPGLEREELLARYEPMKRDVVGK